MELPYPDGPLRRVPTLAWVDVETTGLVPGEDRMLEVGIVVTDNNLVVVDQIVTIIKQDVSLDWLQERTNPYVRSLHAGSGLWDDLAKAKRGMNQSQGILLDFLMEHGLDGQKSPIAGSSVAFDRSFLEYYMPTLAEQFHYRNLDVSAISEWLRRVCPAAVETAPDKRDIHRPLADLEDSINLLRHYTTYLDHSKGYAVS